MSNNLAFPCKSRLPGKRSFHWGSPNGARRNARPRSPSPVPQRVATPWLQPPRPRAPQPRPHPHAVAPCAALYLLMQCHAGLRGIYTTGAVAVGMETPASGAAGRGPGVPARPCVHPPSDPAANRDAARLYSRWWKSYIPSLVSATSAQARSGMNVAHCGASF